MNKLKQIILIKKVRNGDTEAFKEIYGFFADKVHRYIFFRIPVKEDSQDLEQEVFFKLWDYLTKHADKPIQSLSALIYKIAKTTLAAYYQTRDVMEKDKLVLEEVDWKIESQIDAREDVEIKLKIEHLHKKIDQLKNEEYKQIIELKLFDDLTHKQIAQILNKTENNVRVLFHRALKELRDILAQDQND